MKQSSQNSRRGFIKHTLPGAIAVAATPSMGFTLSNSLNDQASTTPLINKPVPRLPCSILMASGMDESFEKKIRQWSPQIVLMKDLDGADRQEALKKADVHFGQIRAEDFALTENLSWVQSVSAGVEHQLYADFANSEVVLTNAKGCYAPAIAEHTFGLLFTLTRKIGAQIRKNQWGGSGDQVEMKNLTMGIVGFGGIGRQVARRAKAMDMRVVAADIRGFYKEQIGDVCDELHYADAVGLGKLFEQSDVVVCATPHTPISEGLFGPLQFGQMKKGAYFINVSRGKLVQTAALQAALESGQIAGAGLDVTDPEPLPSDHPLWGFENVTITSHISGRSQHSWERLQSVFVENVGRYIHGHPLVNLVDKAAGF